MSARAANLFPAAAAAALAPFVPPLPLARDGRVTSHAARSGGARVQLGGAQRPRRPPPGSTAAGVLDHYCAERWNVFDLVVSAAPVGEVAFALVAAGGAADGGGGASPVGVLRIFRLARPARLARGLGKAAVRALTCSSRSSGRSSLQIGIGYAAAPAGVAVLLMQPPPCATARLLNQTRGPRPEAATAPPCAHPLFAPARGVAIRVDAPPGRVCVSPSRYSVTS